jgi:hypothetical protein
MRFGQNKWLRRLVTWVMVPVALIYGFFQYNYPTCTFRYKLTAEVMTPDGLKTGSSVIEVSYKDFYSLSGVPNLMLSARGKAVFVSLGEKRMFVVTLNGTKRGDQQFRSYDDSPEHMTGGLDLYALPLKGFGIQWLRFDERFLTKQIEVIARLNKIFDVPLQNLPLLVVFSDQADPDSVVEVEPENLEVALGPGFKLQRVWLALTDEQPSGPEMYEFPWWNKKIEEQKKLHALGQGQTLINNILDSAFRRPGIWGNNQ